MKKITLIITLFMALNSYAQITLERHSDISLTYIKLYSGEYWYNLATDGILYMYKVSDQSLYKTIAIPTISGYKMPINISTLSEKLYDNDDEIEYFIAYASISGTNYIGKIMNEDGSIIKEIPDSYYTAVIWTGSGPKLYIYYNPSSYSIYSFDNNPINESAPAPGASITNNYYTTIAGTVTVTSIVTVTISGNTTLTGTSSGRLEALRSAYPNPANTVITLGYELPIGSTGVLSIVNMSGILVKEIQVGSDFNEVLADVSAFIPGTYIYYLSGPAGKSPGRSFVVR